MPHATRMKLVVWMCLALLGLAACGPTSPTVTITPTPRPSPTATVTPTSTPTPTATSVPTATPTPRPLPTATPKPKPTSTPIPTTACTPASGISAVSIAVIYTGNATRRQVSLTFDSDNGSPGNAAAYLSILRAHGIRGTWFLTGLFAQANPGLVREIRNDGHDIGDHTFDHPNLVIPERSDAFICSELVDANRAIANVTGRTTRPYFRPPFGAYNYQVRTLAAKLGYRTIFWSIDPRDWDSANTAQDIENSILNSPSLKPGAIILMHVNSAHETEALPIVIAGLEARGYAIVPLSQLLA